ncbi:hypothetical protein EJ03DRAFT_56898 [Teratosphaeria nubilosa]|uniref:Uncharacterized protein n=1 Tax=Teratosphaeria nubilosa TaxID=161662 RepID=A0A6G1LD58_9PEZI|nr:hypothetical protein EJ03DRAFT_56898 [Teratosphaeria nubilosa]
MAPMTRASLKAGRGNAVQNNAMHEVAATPVATVPTATAKVDTPVQSGTHNAAAQATPKKLRLVHNCTCADAKGTGKDANKKNGLFTPLTSDALNQAHLNTAARRPVAKWVEAEIYHNEPNRANQRINKALKDLRVTHRANQRLNKSMHEYRVRRRAGQRMAAAIKADRNARLQRLAAGALALIAAQRRK